MVIMKFVHISDDVVDYGPGVLPENWQNISGLSGLSADELEKFGWFPVSSEKPEYDPATQILLGEELRVETIDGKTQVSEHWKVEDISREIIRTRKLEEAREAALGRIFEKLLSEDTQYQTEIAAIEKE
jgi:hypothetical protein